MISASIMLLLLSSSSLPSTRDRDRENEEGDVLTSTTRPLAACRVSCVILPFEAESRTTPDWTAPYTSKARSTRLVVWPLMLDVDELKAIQGFPPGYILKGTKEYQKKFIGNAVVPEVVAAWLCAIGHAFRTAAPVIL